MKAQTLRRLSVLFLSAAASAQAAPAPAAEDELLVLGVRDDAGALATWLVDRSEIRRAGPGIAVPRNDGLWRISPVTRKSKSIDETRLVATRPGQKPSLPPVDIEDGCALRFGEELLFAGPDFFSIVLTSTGECGDATGSGTSHLQRTLGYGKSDSRGVEALGPEAEAAWRLAAQGAGGGDEKRLAACLADAESTGIGLVRERGRWRLRGELGHATESCRGRHAYFNVDVPLPSRTTGGADAGARWQEATERSTDLVDLLVSPSGTFALLVLPDRLATELDGAPSQSIEAGGLTVVHAQWFIGKAAKRWRQELPKALAR